MTVNSVTEAPSRWKPERSPTPGWTKSRLRGCTGLQVTVGGVTMRTEVLSWVVAPGRKRGRNEVSIFSRVVVFLMEYPRAPELQNRADRADQSVLFFLAGANFWEKHAKKCAIMSKAHITYAIAHAH